MSWSNSYTHTLAYSLDILGALVFWNTPDVTISGMCRIVQLADTSVLRSVWLARLASLKLWGWQVAVLRWLAPRLDDIQANHCELARLADVARAQRILEVLQ